MHSEFPSGFSTLKPPNFRILKPQAVSPPQQKGVWLLGASIQSGQATLRELRWSLPTLSASGKMNTQQQERTN